MGLFPKELTEFLKKNATEQNYSQANEGLLKTTYSKDQQEAPMFNPPFEGKQSYVSDKVSHPSERLHVVAHHLGLKGNQLEGMRLDLAIDAAKKRFEQISGHSGNLLKQASSLGTKNPALGYLHEHGDALGVPALWAYSQEDSHAFLFHFIKDKDKIHIIYVNRGQRHELANPDDPAVSVFTVKDSAHSETLIDTLCEELASVNPTRISQFIHTQLMPHHNVEASAILAKSNQKVGNCAVANTNISWHFELASQLMKQDSNLSFTEAYQQRASAYKAIRMEDRAQALAELLDLGNAFNTPSMFHNCIMQVVRKMSGKDEQTPQHQVVSFLVQRINELNPDALNILLHHVLIDTNKRHDAAKYQWVKEIAQQLPEGAMRQKASDYVKAAAEEFKRVPWSRLGEEEQKQRVLATNIGVLKDFVQTVPHYTELRVYITVLEQHPELASAIPSEAMAILKDMGTISPRAKDLVNNFMEHGLGSDKTLIQKQSQPSTPTSSDKSISHDLSGARELMGHYKRETTSFISKSENTEPSPVNPCNNLKSS